MEVASPATRTTATSWTGKANPAIGPAVRVAFEVVDTAWDCGVCVPVFGTEAAIVFWIDGGKATGLSLAFESLTMLRVEKGHVDDLVVWCESTRKDVPLCGRVDGLAVKRPFGCVHSRPVQFCFHKRSDLI